MKEFQKDEEKEILDEEAQEYIIDQNKQISFNLKESEISPKKKSIKKKKNSKNKKKIEANLEDLEEKIEINTKVEIKKESIHTFLNFSPVHNSNLINWNQIKQSGKKNLKRSYFSTTLIKDLKGNEKIFIYGK